MCMRWWRPSTKAPALPVDARQPAETTLMSSTRREERPRAQAAVVATATAKVELHHAARSPRMTGMPFCEAQFTGPVNPPAGIPGRSSPPSPPPHVHLAGREDEGPLEDAGHHPVVGRARCDKRTRSDKRMQRAGERRHRTGGERRSGEGAQRGAERTRSGEQPRREGERTRSGKQTLQSGYAKRKTTARGAIEQWELVEALAWSEREHRVGRRGHTSSPSEDRPANNGSVGSRGDGSLDKGCTEDVKHRSRRAVHHGAHERDHRHRHHHHDQQLRPRRGRTAGSFPIDGQADSPPRARPTRSRHEA